jgi:hypothetical protein
MGQIYWEEIDNNAGHRLKGSWWLMRYKFLVEIVNAFVICQDRLQ